MESVRSQYKIVLGVLLTITVGGCASSNLTVAVSPQPILPTPTPTVEAFHLFDGATPEFGPNSKSLPPGAVTRLGIGGIHSVKLLDDGKVMWVRTSAGEFGFASDTFELLWEHLTYDQENGRGAVDVSANGSLLASNGPDGLAVFRTDTMEVMWEISDDFKLPTPTPYYGYTFGVSISSNGKWLAAASPMPPPDNQYIEDTRCELIVYNLETHEPQFTRTETGCLPIWAPGQNLLETSGLSTVEIWQGESGNRIATWDADFLSWSPDGSQYAVTHDAVGDNPAYVRIYTVGSKEPLVEVAGRGTQVSWSPDGTRVATYVGADLDNVPAMRRLLQVWDATTGQLIWNETIPYSVQEIHWSVDRKLIGVVQENHWLVDRNLADAAQTRSLRIVFEGDVALNPQPARGAFLLENSLRAWIWSTDGKTYFNVDGTSISARDLETGNELRRINSYASVASLAFNPDGTLLAIVTQDRRITLWDAVSVEPVREIPVRGYSLPRNLSWSPNGRFLALTPPLQIWDVSTGQLVFENKNTDFSKTIAWSPDSEWIATKRKNNDTVSVVSISGKRSPTLFYAPSKTIDFVWTSDNNLVAIERLGDALRAVDVMHNLQTLDDIPVPAYPDPAWSPDKSRIIDLLYPSGRVWDISSGRMIDLEGQGDDPLRLHAIAWSPPITDGLAPDGLIGGGDSSGNVVIWDGLTGKILVDIRAHNGGVESVAWSPDGKILATGSWDGTVILWDVEKLLQQN